MAGMGRAPRHLVLTDIGGDSDDQQGLVRFLVWSDCFEVEGIIPQQWSGSDHRFTPDRQMDLVRSSLDAYAEVFPNLSRHSDDYPDPQRLRAVLKRGAVGTPFALDAGRSRPRKPLRSSAPATIPRGRSGSSAPSTGMTTGRSTSRSGAGRPISRRPSGA